MKLHMMIGLMFFLSFSCAKSQAAEPPETLSELKARAQAVRPEECVRVCADVARHALEEAKREFAKGSIETAQLALRDVTDYAGKATDAAIQTKKRDKQLEIELRAMSHHLDDLKRSVAFEDQSAVTTAMEHLEKLRTRLLESMFGKTKK